MGKVVNFCDRVNEFVQRARFNELGARSGIQLGVKSTANRFIRIRRND